MRIKKKKTEAQQLIQKCIEDVQIQLNVANTKLKEQQSNISAPTNVNNETVDYNEMIKILERKLKILTFIYDNGIQNTKSKKTGLFNK